MWECTYASEDEYEVKFRLDVYVVNLKNRTCACCKWALSGSPCKHAIIYIKELGDNTNDYLSERCRKQQYINTYQYSLHPISGPRTWVVPDFTPIVPPPVRSMPRRPKKNKRLESNESKMKKKLTKKGAANHCSICHKIAHNKGTCPDKAVHMVRSQKVSHKVFF